MITCYQYLFQQNRLTSNVLYTLPTVPRVREVCGILECHPICSHFVKAIPDTMTSSEDGNIRSRSLPFSKHRGPPSIA